jgi:hypothetical protein
MSPWEVDSLITSIMVFALISFMAMIVYKDLIKPSGMSMFGAVIICGVLMTAPAAYLIKNLVVLFTVTSFF